MTRERRTTAARLCASAVLFCTARQASAETVRIPEVEARAGAVPTSTGARDASAFATVVEREELVGRGQDLSEVLERSVGIQVRTFGATGDFSSISIRGSTAEQVEVFLDGVPINRAIGGGLDLSTLPLAHLERVEVYRGTAPARLAVANIGGAVALTSLPTGDSPEGALSGGMGSFGAADVSGHLRGSLGAVRLLGAAGYARTDGDFEFLDDNGTPFNLDDDERTDRVNNAFDQVTGLVKLDVPLGRDVVVALANDAFFKDEGIPGISSFQSRVASLTTFRNVSHLRVAGEGLWAGLLDLEERIDGGYQVQRFRDVDGEIGSGSQDVRDTTVTVGSVTTATFYPADALALTGIVDLRHERFAPQNDLLEPAEGPASERRAVRMAFEAQTALFDERLVLDPVVRFAYVDDHRSPFELRGLDQARDEVDRRWTWKVGARFAATRWLEARANVSSSFRPPTFAELFGDRGSVIGNPTLDPERGFGWDAGLAIDVPALGPIRAAAVEAVWFQQSTRDLILFVQNSQRTAVAQNIAEARTQGVELTTWADLPAGFRLSGNATFQVAEDRSPIPSRRGKDLPGQPREDVFGRLEWRGGPITLHGELHLLGESFLDPANFADLEARLLIAAGARYEPIDGLAITIEATNLTDEQVADVFGFPIPGTSFYGAVEWTFAFADDGTEPVR